MYFLGYTRSQKGYCCYCPIRDKYLIYTDMTFFESIPYYKESRSNECSKNSVFHPFIPVLQPLVADPITVTATPQV